MEHVEAPGHTVHYGIVVNLYALGFDPFLLHERLEELAVAAAQIENCSALLYHVDDRFLVRSDIEFAHVMSCLPPFSESV